MHMDMQTHVHTWMRTSDDSHLTFDLKMCASSTVHVMGACIPVSHAHPKQPHNHDNHQPRHTQNNKHNEYTTHTHSQRPNRLAIVATERFAVGNDSLTRFGSRFRSPTQATTYLRVTTTAWRANRPPVAIHPVRGWAAIASTTHWCRERIATMRAIHSNNSRSNIKPIRCSCNGTIRRSDRNDSRHICVWFCVWER